MFGSSILIIPVLWLRPLALPTNEIIAAGPTGLHLKTIFFLLLSNLKSASHQLCLKSVSICILSHFLSLSVDVAICTLCYEIDNTV